MIKPVITKNDKKAKVIIWLFSSIVFITVVSIGRLKLASPFSFDIHIFAAINATINTIVSLLLVSALIAVKKRNFLLHKNLMLTSVALSCLFLISYILYHLFAVETSFGGVGFIRYIYYFILITHIVLAAVMLPFILFTTYRGLTAEFNLHKKIARRTFPFWLYITVSGVIVYLMISPYYG